MKTILLSLLIAATTTLSAEPARPYGTGTITRDSQGRTAITTPFGNGTITRTSTGRTIVTTPYGNGTISRDNRGRTAITTPYGRQPVKPQPTTQRSTRLPNRTSPAR